MGYVFYSQKNLIEQMHLRPHELQYAGRELWNCYPAMPKNYQALQVTEHWFFLQILTVGVGNMANESINSVQKGRNAGVELRTVML